jgi:hypothetical protein
MDGITGPFIGIRAGRSAAAAGMASAIAAALERSSLRMSKPLAPSVTQAVAYLSQT